MATSPLGPRRGSFLEGFLVQCRVVGALIMRELHTRYGRENVGYLWMIGEPMLLASVIGSLHFSSESTSYGGEMNPLTFTVIGYTTFIVFRGIVNRAEGGIESNASLLYHRMVTIEDIVWSRAILEVLGVFITLVVLMSLIVSLGLGTPPVRPLYVLAAWGLMWWYCIGHALIISAVTHERRTIGRLVHPYAYFMIGLSGAFTPMKWMPDVFRTVLAWVPLSSIFELLRYGWFESASDQYIYTQYVVGACLVTTAIGLLLCRLVRQHVHLS